MKVFIKTWGEIEERLDPLFYLNMMLLDKDIVQRAKYPLSTFKQKLNMQRGRFGHRPRNDPRYYGGDYPFIQTGNIVKASEGNERIEYNQTLNELGLATSRLFDKQAVIMTIAANIGYTAILDYKACFPDSLVALTRKDEKLDLEYLNFYIRFIRKYIENLAPQAAQRNINLKQLGRLPLIIPDKDVQIEVVRIMESAYLKKKQKDKEAQRLLESINKYLLYEIGVNIEDIEKGEKNVFYVNASEVLGGRFDPKKYTQKYQKLFNAINGSIFEIKKLKDLVEKSVPGSWGEDEDKSTDDLILCLTIRATEFDNKYNLNLNNNRVKYRKYKRNMYEKIKLSSGDILIEKSGGSDAQPVGRVAFVEKDMLENKLLAYSNFIQKVTIRNEDAEPQYVYEYLRLMHNIKVTEVMQTQTNGIRNLIMREYFNQNIVLPPRWKQRIVVEEIANRRTKAYELEMEGKKIVDDAKIRVEKMLLGE